MYLTSCYVGALALMFGPRALKDWYVGQTGARMPVLSDHVVIADLILLNLAPLLLAAGWWIGGRARRLIPSGRLLRRMNPAEGVSSRYALSGIAAAIAVLAAVLLFREIRAGGASALGNWSHYDSFIGGRAELISKLSEWDFVGLYTVLPLLVGLLLSELWTIRARWEIAAPLALGGVGAFVVGNLMLLQKRPLLIGFILISLVIGIRIGANRALPQRSRISRRIALTGLGLAAGLFALYAVLLLAPLNTGSSQAGGGGTKASAVLVQSEFARLGPIGYATSGAFVNAGAKLALDSRLSGGAMAVTTRGPEEGVQYLVGDLPARTPLHLEVTVSTPMPPRRIIIALGRSGATYSSVNAALSGRPRSFTVNWITSRPGPVFIVLRAPAASRFIVESVTLERRMPRTQILFQSEFSPSSTSGFTTLGSFLDGGAQVRMRTYEHTPVLEVSADRRVEGIEHPLGNVAPHSRINLSVRVRAELGRPMATLLIGPSASDYVRRTVFLSRTPRTYNLRWDPASAAPAFMAIRVGGPSRFELLRASVSETRAIGHLRQSKPGAAEVPPAVIEFPSPLEAAESSTVSAGVLPFLSFATRTSGPAIVYPALFPRRHAYYPIDLGLWVAGLSTPPTDNLASFRLLNPGAAHAGANAVPFMFVLDSEGGVVVALVGALVIGFVWRLVWSATEPWRFTRLGSAAGALLILFGVYVAQDAATNAVFASYGIGWALGGILVLAVGASLLRRLTDRRQTSGG